MGKLVFEDFIATVDETNKDFVTELHHQLMEGGCQMEIKEAKSGYMVSYRYHKKVIMNYVFRKKGIFARIYGNHVTQYRELLDSLPHGMVQSVIEAPVCKRLINPNDCNSKCAMGYDFILQGERYQKCRNNAFLFLLCEENNPLIANFILKELECEQLADG